MIASSNKKLMLQIIANIHTRHIEYHTVYITTIYICIETLRCLSFVNFYCTLQRVAIIGRNKDKSLPEIGLDGCRLKNLFVATAHIW